MRRRGLLILAACAALALAPAAVAAAQLPPGVASAEGYEITLAPEIGAVGSFGWVALYSFAAGGAGRTSFNPRLVEQEIGGTRTRKPPATSFSATGLVLTSGQGVAISVDGGPPIPTRALPSMPFGLRAAMYTLTGLPLTPKGVRPAQPSVVALDANMQPLPLPPEAEAMTRSPVLETRNWERPAPPARGVCSISAHGPLGLETELGSVASLLHPLRGVPGDPDITCATTTYSWQSESNLIASVLLDADHPGRTPAPISAFAPVLAHPGLFATRQDEGVLVGKRVPGAWLVLEGGESLRERLALLAHLGAQVRLPSASHRKRGRHR